MRIFTVPKSVMCLIKRYWPNWATLTFKAGYMSPLYLGFGVTRRESASGNRRINLFPTLRCFGLAVGRWGASRKRTR